MLQPKNKLNRYIIPFIFLMLGISTAQSQDASVKNLQTVLSSVEDRFQVRFSYETATVADQKLVPPLQTLSLSETLHYIASQTTVSFEEISERYIAVIPANSESVLLCGRLVAGADRTPLSEATISTLTGSYKTRSDEEGYFFIPKTFTETTLSITHIGFETLEVSATDLNEDCPVFLMFTSVALLETVRIQGILVRGIDKNTDGSTVVRSDGFSLVPGQVENDVLQVIQNIPGVESVNETISTINIRGGNNDENLVLWDGIRMYQTGHFFGLISAYNPFITQRLKVFKNGTPAWFGESVSGVIAMHSSETAPTRFEGGLGFNMINANVHTSIPISEKAYIQLSGRRSINSLIQSPAYTTYSDRIFQNTDITNTEDQSSATTIETREDFVFYDLSGKLHWQFSPKDQLQVNVIAIDNDLDIVEEIVERDISETNKLDQTSLAAGIQWKRQWNPDFRSDFKAYGSYYFLAAFNADLLSRQALLQENEVLDLSLHATFHNELSQNLTLHSGYQFSEIGIANTQDVNIPRFRDYEKNVLRTHVVFSQAELRLHEGATLIQGGLRAHYFGKLAAFRIEPRIHLWQRIAENLSVEASAELKNQTTTQRIDFNSDFLGLEKRRWILSDGEQIPLKTSQQAAVGFSYSNNSWYFNATAFYKDVDGVNTNSQGFQNQFQFTRAVGGYTVYGVETLFSRKLKDFYGWISYTYNHNRYTFPTLQPEEFPNNFEVPHRIVLAGTYVWNKLKLSGGLRVHSGHPYTVPLAGNEIDTTQESPQIRYASPNEERLPTYIRGDVAAEYLWKLGAQNSLKINVALLNVLDRKNILNIRYVADDSMEGEAVVRKIEESSLGFTPNVSVQWLF